MRKDIKLAFLESIYCLHTGRKTWERNNKNIKGADEMNEKRKFQKLLSSTTNLLQPCLFLIMSTGRECEIVERGTNKEKGLEERKRLENEMKRRKNRYAKNVAERKEGRRDKEIDRGEKKKIERRNEMN